jgi:purine catabolism regulator
VHAVERVDTQDWHALAVPVRGDEVPVDRWLMIARRGRPFTDPTSVSAAQMTAPLIAALARLQSTSRRHDREDRAAFLEGLLVATNDAATVRTLERRLRLYGFRDDAVARAVVIQVDDGKADDVLSDMDDALASSGRPRLLLARSPDQVVGLVQGEPDDLRMIIAPIRSASGIGAIAVGCGRRAARITEIVSSVRDAQLAVRLVSQEDWFATYDDLSLETMLLSEVDQDRIRDKVDEVLGPLSSRPGLLEAVEAYFACNLDVVAAAAVLGLHPNSVRYRLARVEDLLGRSMRDPATITAIKLAFMAKSVET